MMKWEKQTVKTTYHIEIEAKESWTIIWEFMTKDYDIKFGLKYKESKEHEKDDYIVPLELIESYKSAVYGEYKVDKSGIYILHWDNTYSYYHTKDLKYKIKMKDSEGKSQHLLTEEKSKEKK